MVDTGPLAFEKTSLLPASRSSCDNVLLSIVVVPPSFATSVPLNVLVEREMSPPCPSRPPPPSPLKLLAEMVNVPPTLPIWQSVTVRPEAVIVPLSWKTAPLSHVVPVIMVVPESLAYVDELRNESSVRVI